MVVLGLGCAPNNSAPTKSAGSVPPETITVESSTPPAKSVQPPHRHRPSMTPSEALAHNCELVFDTPTPGAWAYGYSKAEQHPAVPVPDQPSDGAGDCWTIAQHAAQMNPEQLLCFARPDLVGTWAVVTDEQMDADSAGTWKLVFARDGKLLEGFGAVYSPDGDPAAMGGGSPSIAEVEAVVDFDGDGMPEVITKRLHPTDASGNVRAEFSVWTAAGGRVDFYKPALEFRIVGLVDQDEDGRPDLLVDPYTDVLVGSSVGWLAGKRSWSVLAHSTPDGAFAMTDATAVSYAASLCPSPFELASTANDGRCTTGAVHCAGIWSKDAAARLAEVERFCADERAALSADGTPLGMGWCDASEAAWKRMIETPLPVTLTPAE